MTNMFPIGCKLVKLTPQPGKVAPGGAMSVEPDACLSERAKLLC